MSSFITITLLFCLLAVVASPSFASQRNDTYLRDACSVTRYKQICLRSLSPFSALAKKNPSKWARAGVAVTITEVKHVLRRIVDTPRSSLGKRERVALSDCREVFLDALDELHMSLGILRNLNAREFQRQMSDLATWLSAALTDEDTCLDGFEETRSSTVIRVVERRVSSAMYLTSNALALVNRLANAGLD